MNCPSMCSAILTFVFVGYEVFYIDLQDLGNPQQCFQTQLNTVASVCVHPSEILVQTFGKLCIEDAPFL